LNREQQIRYFIQQLTGSLSLLEFEKLAKKTAEDFPRLPDEAPSWPKEERELAEKLIKDLVYKRISVYKTYRYSWEAGRVSPPNEEELKYLKRFVKNFSFVVEFFEEEKEQSPSNAESFEEIKVGVQEDKEALEKLLENDKYRQQAEELLKKYKDKPPSFDEPNENVNSKLEEQITNLQNRIKELEKKPNSNSGNKEKQKLETLKKELETLKRKSKDKQEQSKRNDFPTGLVIGGGVVFAALLLLIILLLKKSKN
jgi:hypothetical protein